MVICDPFPVILLLVEQGLASSPVLLMDSVRKRSEEFSNWAHTQKSRDWVKNLDLDHPCSALLAALGFLSLVCFLLRETGFQGGGPVFLLHVIFVDATSPAIPLVAILPGRVLPTKVEQAANVKTDVARTGGRVPEIMSSLNGINFLSCVFATSAGIGCSLLPSGHQMSAMPSLVARCPTNDGSRGAMVCKIFRRPLVPKDAPSMRAKPLVYDVDRACNICPASRRAFW